MLQHAQVFQLGKNGLVFFDHAWISAQSAVEKYRNSIWVQQRELLAKFDQRLETLRGYTMGGEEISSIL
ncbi:MAG: hypothetical protein ACK4K9_11565 [Bacteroidia bacterium]